MIITIFIIKIITMSIKIVIRRSTIMMIKSND